MHKSRLHRLAGLILGAWLIAGSGPAGAQGTAEAVKKPPVDLELVLAIDVSGSIDQDEARLQRQGYVDAFADPQVIEAIRSGPYGRIAVAYIEWAGSGWQHSVTGWTAIDGAASARALSARLAAAPIDTGPWTSISGAIDYAIPLFGTAFSGTRRVIDISGDGPNNMGRLAPLARDDAVKKRVTINGLPIMNDRYDLARPPMPNLDLYYQNCVIGGPGAFIVVARSFATFGEAIRRKLIMEIAGLSPPQPRPGRAAGQYAQAGTAAPSGGRWAPPCDEGERRFRGIIQENPDN
jgi:hypothetical protein